MVKRQVITVPPQWLTVEGKRKRARRIARAVPKPLTARVRDFGVSDLSVALRIAASK